MELNDKELDIDAALKQAITSIGDRKNKLLCRFGRVLQYADEPKFFQYYGRLNDDAFSKDHKVTSASGFSFFSQKIAVLKCLLEALERYALYVYDPKNLTYAPRKSLPKASVDVRRVVGFSQNQRQKNKGWLLDASGPFNWVLGENLVSGKETYVPAQLLYLSYLRKIGESFIRVPISTGAASGSAYSAAVYRGLCEIIERDAFMITYLNKLPASRVPLAKSQNEQVQKLLAVAADYQLELITFDISTDIDVYTFLSVVRDRTGYAAAISTGMKSSLDPMEALIGSLQESFHPRAWLRSEMDKFKGNLSELIKPVELFERGVLWSRGDSVKELDFLLKCKKTTKNIDDYQDRSTRDKSTDAKKVIRMLSVKKYEVYAVDITPKLPNIIGSPFKVVMTVVPEMQPFYLDENYRFLGGRRLYEVPVKLGYFKKPLKEEELNTFPHPFL